MPVASFELLRWQSTAAKDISWRVIRRTTIIVTSPLALSVSQRSMMEGAAANVLICLEQLNAAKGRMRTVLHRKTFAPIKWLQKATCECRYKTQFEYIGALIKTGVWPLDDEWPKMEVNEVLDKLSTFSYKPAPSACKQYCQRSYEDEVGKTISYIRGYFDGLCLDCIDKGNPKTWNHDTDYWNHDRLKKHEWDKGCRVKHGEPTWWFSFLGRKEDRDQFCKDNDITLKAP